MQASPVVQTSVLPPKQGMKNCCRRMAGVVSTTFCKTAAEGLQGMTNCCSSVHAVHMVTFHGTGMATPAGCCPPDHTWHT